MIKFNIGDRVKVAIVIPGGSTVPEMIGKKGTVLDRDEMPNVRMDDSDLNDDEDGFIVFFQEELELTEWI